VRVEEPRGDAREVELVLATQGRATGGLDVNAVKADSAGGHFFCGREGTV
jgi:hypothetical protein